jgi:hypothetical protein
MLSHDLGNTNITLVGKEIFSGLHICIELTKNCIRSNFRFYCHHRFLIIKPPKLKSASGEATMPKGLTQIQRVAFISYKIRISVGL